MKSILSGVTRAIAALALVAVALVSAQAQNPQYPQQQSTDASKGQNQKPGQELSPEERQALMKISETPDVQTKLTLATDFVAKFPRSSKRRELAAHVAGEIAKVTDPAQEVSLSESYLKAFVQPEEVNIIAPVVLDAYIKVKRFDDAFRFGATHLENNQDDVPTLTHMALVGTEQAKEGNRQYIAQSVRWGDKAIELIEADKMPATMDVATWTDYKTKWLPSLYQYMGILAFMSGNNDEARAKLDKAMTLNPSDPTNYYVLGSLVDSEYQKVAQEYKGLPAGKLQDDTLKQAYEKMDQVIEYFAHAIGLAEGDARYQQLHDGLLNVVQNYYKYRHNGSTDGMQQLIDKYKKPATQPQ